MPLPTGGSVIQPMGSSEQLINGDALSMEAALHVVLDDPKPIPVLQAAGSTVIFRRASDDHAHENTDPLAFVAALDAQAPPGAWLHLGNEPGRGNLSKLNDWTLVALKECRKRGRIGVAFNFSTGEPERDEWAALTPAIAYAIATGQWVGVHEYYLHSIERGINEQHVGRCRVLRSLYPTLNICLTEVGMVTGLVNVNGVWMYNPNAGWQAGTVTAAEAGAEVAKGVLTVWSKIGAPVTNFLEGHWDRTTTFNTAGQAEFFKPIREANRQVRKGTVSMEGQKTVTITSSSPVVNVRALPSTSGKILIQIPTGAVVFALNQQVQAGGHLWQALDFGSQTAWLSLSVCKLN